MFAEALTAKCNAEPHFRRVKRHRSKSGSKPENLKSAPEASGTSATSSDAVGEGMAQFLKKKKLSELKVHS